MTVETATYVTQLNSSLPAGGNSRSEGDDHMRLTKAVLLATFPALAGAVTASHTELNQLDGVTLGDAAQKTVGAALGVCGLDADAKVATANLPDAVIGAMQYQGSWNATTNTPTMAAASTGNKGYYFVVSVAGTTTIDGISDWEIGDWIVSNGTVWEKIDNSDKVSSVAGRTGAVTLSTADVSGLGTMATQAATAVNIDGGNIDGATLGAAANVVMQEYSDTVYAITDGAAFEIDPANGAVQTITLGASRTPKATNLASGQSVLMKIIAGAYTITWTDATLSPSWLKVGGSGTAPTLSASGTSLVLVFKIGTTMFGAHLGDI